jgi:hypothetical protein
MVAGQEDPLHPAEAEHSRTLEQKVPHCSLSMGATTATGHSLFSNCRNESKTLRREKLSLIILHPSQFLLSCYEIVTADNKDSQVVDFQITS